MKYNQFVSKLAKEIGYNREMTNYFLQSILNITMLNLQDDGHVVLPHFCEFWLRHLPAGRAFSFKQRRVNPRPPRVTIRFRFKSSLRKYIQETLSKKGSENDLPTVD